MFQVLVLSFLIFFSKYYKLNFLYLFFFTTGFFVPNLTKYFPVKNFFSKQKQIISLMVRCRYCNSMVRNYYCSFMIYAFICCEITISGWVSNFYWYLNLVKLFNLNTSFTKHFHVYEIKKLFFDHLFGSIW